jgi:2-oxoglutarate ferredoxin oxidoreductase subunit beta
MSDTQVNPKDFNSPVKPTWCPGCGNFTILNAIRASLVSQNLSPQDILMVYDIGCNGNMADKINAYGFKGLHGRVLPTAAGASIANTNLPVIAIGGDGGSLDEGMHHFIHTIRNNYNVTFIMHNNCNFGLTTGQETPTTPKGQPMAATPWGAVGERINPVQLAMVSGASWIANGWTGNTKQVGDLITAGMNHKGFSFINVYQDCPTYNKFENLEWLRNKVQNVEEIEGYDPTNWEMAFKAVDYNADKRPVGIVYTKEDSPDFMDRMTYQTDKSPLKDQVRVYPVEHLLEEFK